MFCIFFLLQSDVEKKRGTLSPKYICDNLWKYLKNTRLHTYERVLFSLMKVICSWIFLSIV